VKNILVIGGGGYVGTALVDQLIEKKYNVTVYDLFIYGNYLIKNKNLNIIRGDIRDLNKLKKIVKSFNSIIHLACISNDPSFDLDPDLGKSINFDPFEELIKISKDNGVTRFIYASSSSVYGVKSDRNVVENFSLEPLTDYSKYKAMCEDILLKYNSKNFNCTILRPATVCGYSRRQRLDLIVNVLTNHGYNKKIIKIFGGKQLRPNINIFDMCNSYIHILNQPADKINGEIFNVGFENYTVTQLSYLVKKFLPFNVYIEKIKTNDNRSYHISSKKIKNKIGFESKKNIKDAINDLVNAFQKKLFLNPLTNQLYFNISRMKSININKFKI
jgi:nucleoside-diphosphate-sugar epimerase